MSQRRMSTGKVVILGGPGVGKSAFAVRYITKRYIGDYDQNKEMMYTHKVTTPRDEITLEILDTAAKGPPELLEQHIKWGDGFVFIYSMTDRHSYQELCRLKDIVFSNKSPETPVVLVSNKCDLLTARAVTEDDGLSLAGDLDCPKYEISVAEGAQGVLDVMEELVRQLQREYVKNLTTRPVESLEKRSKLYNMKRAFKKRIARSRSDTF